VPDRVATAADFASRSLRLETLIRLRWLAVVGQAVAVLFVEVGLGFPLPIGQCFVLIAVSALLNIVLGLRFPASRRLGTWPAFALLAYDAVQLAGLLYLTGGLENPFAFLLLVPVIVSATALGSRPTVILGVVVIGMASVLALFHQPLPWYPGESLPLPLVYVAGMWVALTSACVFTGVYTYRVAKEARRLATALSATELVLAREQHLSALDGLAAAAAHELGTPLATIALVAKELEREFPPGSAYSDDVALLKSQSERCRDILTKLTSLSEQGDRHLDRLPLSHLIEEVVEPYRAFGVEIAIAVADETAAEPVGHRNPAIVYGLANLVENAVDFALSKVEVKSQWTDADVAITITDDGPGFAAGIIDRIGEPYVTTRGRPSDGVGADHEAGGLGLGFFIAKTLLERTGARLTFANREPPETGARVGVVWPRSVMDAESPESKVPAETMTSGTSWRLRGESL
jgi:two-component system sensor histidine kinase RegB